MNTEQRAIESLRLDFWGDLGTQSIGKSSLGPPHHLFLLAACSEDTMVKIQGATVRPEGALSLETMC